MTLPRMTQIYYIENYSSVELCNEQVVLINIEELGKAIFNTNSSETYLKTVIDKWWRAERASMLSYEKEWIIMNATETRKIVVECLQEIHYDKSSLIDYVINLKLNL